MGAQPHAGHVNIAWQLIPALAVASKLCTAHNLCPAHNSSALGPHHSSHLLHLVAFKLPFNSLTVFLRAQVIHCRWAMLGAAGMFAPEALAAWGVTPSVTGLPWFKTGVIPPAGTEYNYWADNYTLFYLEAIAMNFAELKRLQDYK